TVWSPLRRPLKFSNRRSAVVLITLNIEITLHRGSHDIFLFSASRNSSAVRSGLGLSSFGSNRHPPMPLCMRSSHLHSMPSEVIRLLLRKSCQSRPEIGRAHV